MPSMKHDYQNRLSNSHHSAMRERRDPVRDPRTKQEWQEAVELAEAWLQIESARAYGLISGGPQIDAERCQELLEKGAKRGFRPRGEAVERILLELAGA